MPFDARLGQGNPPTQRDFDLSLWSCLATMSGSGQNENYSKRAQVFISSASAFAGVDGEARNPIVFTGDAAARLNDALLRAIALTPLSLAITARATLMILGGANASKPPSAKTRQRHGHRSGVMARNSKNMALFSEGAGEIAKSI